MKMAAEEAPTATATAMVFVYGTLKRGFPNHPHLAASASLFAGKATTVDPVSLIVGPYSVPFLLLCSSSGRRVSGELYAVSPRAIADLDELEGTHLGVYERRQIRVVVDDATGSGKEVKAEAYFAHVSYAEALWRCCGGEAAEIGEYTVEHAGGYVPPSARCPGASGLMDAIHSLLLLPTPVTPTPTPPHN